MGKKLVHIRKPRLRVTPRGVKLTRPSARIGGKVGVNISRSGVSASARTKLGTVSTGRASWAKRKRSPGCFTMLMLFVFVVVTQL